MTIEAYINKIFEETGLTRKEIKDLVEEKKVELKGLISEEGALFIIAKELGVDVKDENKELLKDIEINISDITENMKNITLVGRIKEIYRVSSFERKEGGKGTVGSFLLHDKTGDIRITLWDEHVKIFNDSNFDINELVKIINGYAKKGRTGEPEIHIGRLGKIILSPEDIDYRNYSKIKSKIIPIKNINLNMKSVSIEGSVLQVYPTKEFTRKDGSPGKVKSLILLDSSGSSIRITFWNEDTEKAMDFEVDNFISLTNLNPRLSTLDSKTIQLHANNYTAITKKDKKLQIKSDLVEKIESLQKSTGIVSLQGIISSVDNLRKVSLKSGDEASLLGFVVSDDSDGIRGTLWNEKAEEFSETLKVGMGILLKNVMVKYSNFSGRNEISFINDSSIEIVDIKIDKLKDIEPQKKERASNFIGNYTKIDSINSAGIFEIKGYIAKEINNIIVYEACSNCNRKVDNCICDTRGDIESRLIFNIFIDDGSSTIKAVFGRNVGEKFLGEETELIKKLKETPDFEKFLKNKSNEYLGKDIIIRGRAKFSDFSNSYEMSVYDFKGLNINEELDRVMKEIET
ncbi:MAG: DUF2240 family protein [Promethearchaeota archaeon]|nr:MAG: DUF2240 family protein [Candidatus Lokiarchaeota archaeon]